VSYAIAAAGTGGHVYPGLAVGEALIGRGVAREDILYVGGGRLEAEVYPRKGFPFLSLELRGLQRKLTAANLGIPRVVLRARDRMIEELRGRGVRVVLGMGGYVTVPAGLAARKVGAHFAVSEQNAVAGLANRVMARMASAVFGSFPETRHLPNARWVGNPVRSEVSTLDKLGSRTEALRRYELSPSVPVLGVVGGSLGSGAINKAVSEMAVSWAGPDVQILHISGPSHAESLVAVADNAPLVWRVLAFEDDMASFYGACDLVIARAGGAVAELTVTATPGILIPGSFGSAGHQRENAAVLAAHGAAEVLEESRLSELGATVQELIGDSVRLEAMARAAAVLAKPRAADEIAETLESLHG